MEVEQADEQFDCLGGLGRRLYWFMVGVILGDVDGDGVFGVLVGEWMFG